MTRRILPLALSLVLLAAAVPPASAQETGFTPIRSYEDPFEDVRSSDWYYEHVDALYELGLTNGQGANSRFAPEADMTVAEVVTMVGRLRSLYEYGGSETGPALFAAGAGSWYEPYAAYLRDRGAIGGEFDGLYEKKISRAQMAHVLARVLPQSLFTEINAQAVAVGYANRNYITDVDDYTPYRDDILLLYRWGILSGTDRTGSFLPDRPIRRGEAAVMVARLVYSDLRLELDWDLSLAYIRAGTTMESLVASDGTFHPAPDPEDTAAVEDDVRYMLSRGERQIALSYEKHTLTTERVDALLQAFMHTVRLYVEQGYNEVNCTFSLSTGSVVLTFSSSLCGDRMLESYREAAMEAAITVHDQLWADGRITPAMSEYEKAMIYFTWLCENCAYDFSSTDTSLSHSGYSALVNGVAVCDGYTAAYNLLLKLEGISCATRSAADHIWTVAQLDGTVYHIDPTWGDRDGAIAYRYFGMSEDAAMARFA